MTQFRISNFGFRNWPTAILVVTLTFGVLLAPFAAEAQQAGRMYRLGILQPITPAPSAAAPLWSPIPTALREVAYVVGPNLSVERQSALGKLDRLPRLMLARKDRSVLREPGPRPVP